MDDRRLVLGCSNGAVQVVDLRGGAGAEGAQLQAHTVLPMHHERVRHVHVGCCLRWCCAVGGEAAAARPLRRGAERLALLAHSAGLSSTTRLPLGCWPL